MADHPQKGEKKTALNWGNVIKLSTWIDVNTEWLKKERPTYPEAAAKATADLGFEVTCSNVKHINKSRGYVWKPPGSAQPGNYRQVIQEEIAGAVSEALTGITNRLAENERALKGLNEKLTTLEDTIVRLCKNLGEKPPVTNPSRDVNVANRLGK